MTEKEKALMLAVFEAYAERAETALFLEAILAPEFPEWKEQLGVLRKAAEEGRVPSLRLTYATEIETFKAALSRNDVTKAKRFFEFFRGVVPKD